MNPEERFINFCKNRKWDISKIPESKNKTPDFIVNTPKGSFIAEVKVLKESGSERKDIEKFEVAGIKGQSYDGWKEVDSISNKINECRSQFRESLLQELPNVLILYSERKFVSLDKEKVMFAMYGKVYPRICISDPNKKLTPLIIDRTLRHNNDNIIISAVCFPKINGMHVIHNKWANTVLSEFIFDYPEDINDLCLGESYILNKKIT